MRDIDRGQVWMDNRQGIPEAFADMALEDYRELNVLLDEYLDAAMRRRSWAGLGDLTGREEEDERIERITEIAGLESPEQARGIVDAVFPICDSSSDHEEVIHKLWHAYGFPAMEEKVADLDAESEAKMERRMRYGLLVAYKVWETKEE